MKKGYWLCSMLGLVLATTGAAASPPGAEAPPEVPPPTVNILKFEPGAPLSPTRLAISAVRHEVTYQPTRLHVVTTWTVGSASLKDVGGLFVGGPSLGNAKVLGATIDGVAAPTMLFQTKPWYVAFAAKPGAGPTTAVAVTYDAKIPAGPIQTVGRSQFLKLARYTTKGAEAGFDLRPLAPFSYADPVATSLRVLHGPEVGVLGSSPAKAVKGGAELASLPMAQPALVFFGSKAARASKFTVGGATFHFVTRSSGGQMDPAAIERAVRATWPAVVKRFGRPSAHFVFVELGEGGLSGGFLGTNVTALFARAKIGVFERLAIKNLLGWPAAASTKEYIAAAYQGAKDPWDEYLTGMVAHELMHLVFGFGSTTERVAETYEEWTSLGLGMVYDDEITRSVTGRPAALFEASERVWQDHYAKDPKIDQRLEHPDTAKDPPDLARVQTYAHSKARWVLRQLRAGVGPEAFDHAVAAYLAAPPEAPDQGWARLRGELLKVSPKTPTLAADLGI